MFLHQCAKFIVIFQTQKVFLLLVRFWGNEVIVLWSFWCRKVIGLRRGLVFKGFEQLWRDREKLTYNLDLEAPEAYSRTGLSCGTTFQIYAECSLIHCEIGKFDQCDYLNKIQHFRSKCVVYPISWCAKFIVIFETFQNTLWLRIG